MRADEIRSRFIRYFQRQGHEHLPSSSLVPRDDPTLLFTNAGMVQFKRVFLGEEERPAARAVTSQKCLRVSGKHNDLEEVGRTARHHTFFEMLGNFSFGDYFKRDAIRFAWEFVTDELGLEPERLYATVHHTDDEAHALWLECSDIPARRIFRLGDEDNFWQMGETGPCGPCSEIHYDLRTAKERRGKLDAERFQALGEADRFMEIWNLVFMQFDRTPEGDRPLPAPCVDTGAGLERIAAILQGTGTNYHTDLFLPIIARAEAVVGRKYSREPERWEEGLPFRVLADHSRAVAFMLADGVFPSNEGRGYVLRRILRRAGRYAWLLGRREPTLDALVEVVTEGMGDVYPELVSHREHIRRTTRAEEVRFLDTLDAGMARFDEVAPAGGSGTISGEDAFRLYDTYGFPLDLTQLMAGERGYGVDVPGFERALEAQRERSRGAREERPRPGEKRTVRLAFDAIAVDPNAEQVSVVYDRLRVETLVLGFERSDGAAAFVLQENPFYVEAGGQVSDTGYIEGDGWRVRVDQVLRNERDQTVVVGPLVEGDFARRPGRVVAQVDERARRDTERNHTATHLLHAALRAELGPHVQQAGSLVAPDRLRFDFSHHGPLTPDEKRAVERRVNESVWANVPLEIGQRPYREAIEAGAMALFGEKYGDVVRVVRVPGVSAELCGGCHVRTTGQIGLFLLTAESGVAAGIRRVEAVTGPEAYRRVRAADELLGSLAVQLRVPTADLPRRLDALLEERERLEAVAAARQGERAEDVAGRLVEEAEPLPEGGRLVRGRAALPAGSDLAEFGDRLRAGLGSGAAIVAVEVEGDGKRAFLAVVTDDWIGRGVKAGDLVRIASRATGSGGGGKPHLAQGGIGDAGRVDEALGRAVEHVVALAAAGSR